MTCGGLSAVETRTRRHTALGVAAAAAWAAVWAGAAAGLLVIAPRFEEIFRDFGVALPWITRVVLGVSWWCRASPFAGVVGVLVVGASIATGLVAGRSRSAAPAIAVLLAALFAGAAIVALFALAFAIPHSQMVNSLQGG